MIWSSRKQSLSLFPLFPHFFFHEVMWVDIMILVFWMLSFKPAFSLSWTSSRGSLAPLCILPYKRGVICIAEVIDISPSTLDSSLCFIQPGISHYVLCIRISLVAQLVKNPPAMQETWVRSLGWEDPLEKGKAPHCILAWRMPWGHRKSDTTEWLP